MGNVLDTVGGPGSLEDIIRGWKLRHREVPTINAFGCGMPNRDTTVHNAHYEQRWIDDWITRLVLIPLADLTNGKDQNVSF
jgi:hypothetical protein